MLATAAAAAVVGLGLGPGCALPESLKCDDATYGNPCNDDRSSVDEPMYYER